MSKTLTKNVKKHILSTTHFTLQNNFSTLLTDFLTKKSTIFTYKNKQNTDLNKYLVLIIITTFYLIYLFKSTKTITKTSNNVFRKYINFQL